MLKSETAESKKQSTKALKKVDSLEREVRQIRALLEGRDSASGASIKSRLSSADEGQQVTTWILMLACSFFMAFQYVCI